MWGGRGSGQEESSETPRLIADALEFIAGPLTTVESGTAARVVGAGADLAKRTM